MADFIALVEKLSQTTDVEIEVNGLMTYDRKVIKVDMPRIAKGNKSVIESMSK